MEVSVGLYALIFIFFFLVIPGYIARRAYCNGEFSKQVNWNTNVLANFISSLFIGILVTLTFTSIFNLFSHTVINIDAALNKFDSYFISSDNSPLNHNDNSSLNAKFTGFTKNVYKIYLPFICSVYLFAAIVGFFMNRIVLSFGLDVRFKLLRFANNWYYLFSGKILQIRKDSSTININKKVKYTYLDVLVAEKGEETTLYSGLFANYDVSFSDINKLEKIYLAKATRWKKTGDSYTSRNIPGDIFAIMADKILNINCTYVFYNDNEIKDKKSNRQKRLLVSFKILIVLFFLTICLSLLFSFNIFNSPDYLYLLYKPLIVKIVILFNLNFMLGLLTPFEINYSHKKIFFIGWSSLIYRIIGTIVLVGIIFYIIRH